jgi:hypothetical protein
MIGADFMNAYTDYVARSRNATVSRCVSLIYSPYALGSLSGKPCFIRIINGNTARFFVNNWL